jgi:general L-amino acid transport system permease protein
MGAAMLSQPGQTSGRVPFYRNVRVLAVLAQVAFVLGVVALGWLLLGTMLGNLRQQGIPISFAFLGQPAGFGIAEGLPFSPSQSYLTAFGVGVVNTIRVAVAGIVLATLIGIAVGVARLSRNWLLQRLATAYVETFRNVPLLLWLIFTYAAIRESLPRLRDGPALLWGMVLMSNRGIAIVWPRATATFAAWLPWILAALAVGLGVWAWTRWQQRRAPQGPSLHAVRRGSAVSLLLLLVGFVVTWALAQLPERAAVDQEERVAFVDQNGNGTWEESEPTLAGVRVTLHGAGGMVSVVTQEDGRYTVDEPPHQVQRAGVSATAPLMWSRPQIRGFNYGGGLVLSPEFAALLFGLVIYTGAFIAEIVRAGILAVARGQREAAKALGLSDHQTFVLVILPQALRIIIPPLINQYLNLTKNSSLAIAVGYPDLFSIGLTINNQTGQAIPFVIMIMVSYLSMSLLTSLVLNMVNRRWALKTT